ncbi:MAG: tRNA (adenosine(37)-N6)-threonylcarbamoyltransferase complex dimerization subunit type 1 TsaB [Alphaproteobacteria bacterium]|nr:tRNA (adenosine(37)-N6)-threonylcarbamoyltransferase complex dimerization subunit type 1 TsaB [Alphaproteobacteria bacterium]
MYILGLDTSNGYSHVCISYNSNIIFVSKDQEANTQAENLLPMINKALHLSSISYNDLNYIAACAGPGSFTGIRVALATARALSIALPDVKTIKVNNFQTIYYRVCEQVKTFDYCVAFVNAYRNQLYLQVFDKYNPQSPPLLMFMDEAKNYLESLSGRVILAGSGIEKLYTATKLPPENISLLPRFAYPDGRFVCKVASTQIYNNTVEEVLEPLYIREPDAKIPQ